MGEFVVYKRREIIQSIGYISIVNNPHSRYLHSIAYSTVLPEANARVLSID
jgi:hypothetical protein